MPDDHHRATIQARNTADDRFVIGVSAIARQLFEVGKDVFDIIQGIRTARVACQLGNLPSPKIGKNLARQLNALFTQALNLFVQINI